MAEYFWPVLAAALLIFEAITLGLTTIWFAFGAIAAYVATLLGGGLAVQLAAFFVVSLLTLIFTRPIALKYFNDDRVKTNLDSLIGQKAKVVQKIDNINASGRVMLNGLEWTARSSGRDIIEEGTTVTVVSISGVKLIVSPSEETAEGEDKNE